MEDAVNDPMSGEAFQMMKKQNIPDWSILLIAGWVAKQYMSANLQSQENHVDMNHYHQVLSSKIKHWPYLKTLPWYRGLLCQEHILFWSEDAIDTLLKGSLAYNDAMLLRTRVTHAMHLLNEIMVEPWLRCEKDLKDSSQKHKNFDLFKDIFTGAMVIALSRSFAEDVEYDDGSISRIDVETMLIPLLDILQHSNNPNTIIESYPDYVVLKARRSIQSGEELFHQYQEENEAIIPPHKFFTRYGFFPGVREPVIDLLEKKSSIFFADDSSPKQ